MILNDLKVRTRIVFAVIAIGLLCLVFRLYHVQIKRHLELYSKAKGKYTAVASKTGQRGKIYDYHGNLLVGNIPCTDIVADPMLVGNEEKCRALAVYFARNLDLSYLTVFRRLSQKTRIVTDKNGKKKEIKLRYAVIAIEVDFQKAQKIEKEIAGKGYKGLFFNAKNKRFYPKSELLANILGFTNIDRDKAIAVVGIEKFFHKEFLPSKAKAVYERARDGVPLSYGKKDVAKAKDGLNVSLTISEPIQAILEEELDKLVAEWKPRAAYAVMANPYNGNIMAIAQRPTFNPNNRKTMKVQAWRNRITEDIFEPGSTMKPIAIAGAIDYGVVTPQTVFDCEKGYWFYGGKQLRDSHPYEDLTVEEIIQKSSNIGTAKIALSMGESRLYQTLKRFGFGQKTGIPLKPETAGIFRPLKRWDTLSITRFPIGQGIAVSPLQLLRSYCALANGGKLVKLRMVDRIENPASNISVKMPLETPKKVFFRKKTHVQIVDMMKKVTKPGGTATKAAIEGYEVAGKTGTSQKWLNGAYSNTKYFSSFIGFVPADNPAFVLLVTADEPERCHYGGTVAAPTFRNISKKTLRLLNIKPRFDVANAK